MSAEEIVRKLTKAQAKWVRHGLQPQGPGKWPVRNNLVSLGLAKQFPWRWTALGYEVRRRLLENTHD